MSRLYSAGTLAALAVMFAGEASAREIGMVSIMPNAATGELRADLPARPDGETVYIMRDGERVATAKVETSGRPGGALLKLSPAEAGRVRIGDRISLSPDLTTEQQLPLSAYQPVEPGRQGGAAAPGRTGGVLPPLSAAVEKPAAIPVPSPRPGRGENAARSLDGAKAALPEKTGPPKASIAAPPPPPPAVAPVSPRLTPRGSDITLYPAPAVVPEAGVLGPYGVGLAAAAPVGTPYLRSPAFAGPPVIYMPQTVTRVLMPSVTPYPANIMVPPVRYPYASAPFTRTDLYVNLPYGTYYWPNGYAGTTPVEPQLPVYVTAPATAVLTSEASYTTQRYAPGAALAEAANPITVPPVAAAGPSVAPQLLPEVMVGDTVSVRSSTSAAPPPISGAPSVAAEVPGDAIPGGAAPAPAVLPPLEPLTPFPSLGAADPAPLAPLPAAAIDATAPAAAPASPFAADAPPALSAAPADASAIIVDNSSPNAVDLQPAEAWQPSRNPLDSYLQSSVIAPVKGAAKTATFKADIPESGEYEVQLFWAGSNQQFRSAAVPVIIHTASGPVRTTIDQTRNTREFNPIGTYRFEAGQNKPVVTITTEGITVESDVVSVSADALKLVKVQ